MTVWVQLVLIGHLPCPACYTVIIRCCFRNCLVLRLLGVECISVEVLFGSDFAGSLSGINLEYRVIGSIDVGIDTQTEEMLMVVCVDSWVDFCSPAFGVLAWVHGVGV